MISWRPTPRLHTFRESEFASLLTSFLPQPVPLLALVAHQPADQSVFYIADQLAKQPTLSEGTLHVTYAVWKRFDEVSRLRILDTSRRSRMDQRRGGVLKVPLVRDRAPRLMTGTPRFSKQVRSKVSLTNPSAVWLRKVC